MMTMFKKILIANRGEIACRVIRTCRSMGIASVAVYSEADAEALHVQMADEAVLIGPAPSRESYLVMEKIIAAAKTTGAQAIHPGYGFLSENETFAKLVEDEGLVFIGPKYAAIASMGDKIASKKLAMASGVNTIPGYNEVILDAQQAVKIAQNIGYPVMLKASAGGGGKGLRVAFNDQQAEKGFIACANEARNAFGDDRIFIEKFIAEPRHIEIQILGDSFGNVVFLWERECSIQRRHQKVIEEAPSPFISEKTRQAMGAQAVALAKAVNYQSAGTVEFVVGKDESFYFLEMNTRLQVEHPVTEMITGLDLVEQMLRVAAGQALAFKQGDIPRNGWAMECRINAEDPYRGFLPSTGRLTHYQPNAKEGISRIDTGFYEGSDIPMFYDSMIAKVITHGQNRQEAIARMQFALNEFVIAGVHSNIPFQAALMQHPSFQAGDFNTGFIAEHFPDGFHGLSPSVAEQELLSAIATTIHLGYLARSLQISGQLDGHTLQTPTSFEVLVGPSGQQSSISTTVKYSEKGLWVEVGQQHLCIESDWHVGSTLYRAQINGQPYSLQVARQGVFYILQMNGICFQSMVMTTSNATLQKLMPMKVAPDLSQYLLSPMPGLLVQVAVQVGQKVQAGERLAAIEAMKMENILFASQVGVVAEILVEQGQSLSVDQVIMRFE